MDNAERAFFQAVEARITSLRGKGYALSGIEAHMVADWWQRGCPLAVVLAAIDKAGAEARRRGHAERLGIAAIGRSVDELMSRRARGGLGSEELAADDAELADARVWLQLKQLVQDVGRRQPDGPMRDFWRRAWRSMVRDETAGGDPWVFAAEMDAAVARELADLVPADVITSAIAEARRADGYGEASPRARDDIERVARGRAMRAYLGLPELMEALLHP